MRKINGDKLTHEVTATSRTFYRNQDLEVVVGGSQAMTNGKTVYLPSIPLGVDYNEDEVRTIRGFVDHEAGHGRHTDFNLAKRKKYRELMQSNQHFMPITNGLEDVRIERLITKEYPGSKRNLEATSKWANNLYLNGRGKDTGKLGLDEIGAVAITWEGRRRMGYEDETIQRCLDTLDSNTRQAVNAAVDMISKAKSTKDCMEVAIKLLDQWGLDYHKEEEEEEKEEESEGQGQDDEQGDDQQDGQSGDSQEDSQDGESGEGQGSDAEDGAEDESQNGGQDGGSQDGESEDGAGSDAGDRAEGDGDSGEDNSQSAGGGDNTEQGEHNNDEQQASGHGFDPSAKTKPKSAYDPNLDKAMQNIVKNKSTATSSYTPLSRAYDMHERDGCWGKNTLWAIDSSKTNNMYEKYRKSIGPHMNKMRRNLERALIATQDRTWRSGYEEGKLDSRRLSRAVGGDASVYRQRTDSEDIDTCVMLCLDASGSMNQRRVKLAMECTIAMGEVFEKVGIPYAVTAYNTEAHEIQKKRKEYNATLNNNWKINGRSHAISTYLLKDYDENLRKTRHQIAAYKWLVHSANTDGDSIMYINQEYVQRRPEKKKIMFVFSDGEPVGTNDAAEWRRLKEVCLEVEKQAELVGFGIQADVSAFYSKYVQVNDLNEMSGKVMKEVSRLLMGKRFKVDAKGSANAA